MTYEVRMSCARIEDSRSRLDKIGATYINPYSFTDRIYQPLSENPFDYDREFVRIRQYHETHWDQKPVLLSHKIRQGDQAPKFEPLEFDTLEAAEAQLSEDFELDLSFFRKGYEYRWNDVRIFLEDIEYLGTSMELLGERKRVNDIASQLLLNDRSPHSVAEEINLFLKQAPTLNPS
jgi:hypothetical protein